LDYLSLCGDGFQRKPLHWIGEKVRKTHSDI